MKEEELIKESQAGNKEAFTKLILQYKETLYKIAKSRLKDDDIYDAIQETMLKAFKSIKHLKNSKYFKTWIIKILINECNYIYKKNKQYSSFSNEMITEENLKDQKQFENIENKLDLNFLIKNLKREDQIIILLYYSEKFTDKEIGTILNMKEATIRTKRSRAKNKIKEIYESEVNADGHVGQEII